MAAPNHKFRQCIERSALFPGRADRAAEADEVSGGAIAVSIRESGAMPLENFSKINFEIAYFFCIFAHWIGLICSVGKTFDQALLYIATYYMA